MKVKAIKIYASVTLKASDAIAKYKVYWFRYSFLEFLGSIGAQVLTVYSVLGFLMSHAHEYTKNRH